MNQQPIEIVTDCLLPGAGRVGIGTCLRRKDLAKTSDSPSLAKCRECDLGARKKINLNLEAEPPRPEPRLPVREPLPPPDFSQVGQASSPVGQAGPEPPAAPALADETETAQSEEKEEPMDRDAAGRAKSPALAAIGARLESARWEKNLSMDKLARMAGVSPNTVWNAEKGRKEVTRRTLEKLAQVLEVTLSWLLGLEGERPLASSLVGQASSLSDGQDARPTPTLADLVKIQHPAVRPALTININLAVTSAEHLQALLVGVGALLGLAGLAQGGGEDDAQEQD
ncbi:MAG: helix-turn-helix transcriptional regulator [Thermodesulfobacteriota bacterium]